jgi:phosphatidyl-myo-inositol alpha-mannosyltransferase
MRVAITNPFNWPYVRRGNERLLAGMVKYLTRRGYDVVTVTGKPGPSATRRVDGHTSVELRQLAFRGMRRVRIHEEHLFALQCARYFRKLDADVVHSLFYADAFVANQFRRRGGYRTVCLVPGMPQPSFFARVPPFRAMLASAIRNADRCVVVSEAMRQIVREHYGVEGILLAPPIDLEDFPLREQRHDGPPTLVFVASCDDPRKGFATLVKAFVRLKQEIADLRLLLSGDLSDNLRRQQIDSLAPDVRASIELHYLDPNVQDLYRRAHLLVLPSMWEAYGMVVVEAWASGIPVVVTDHGGLRDLARDCPVAVTFNPQTDALWTDNVEGLVEAIRRGLALSQKPGVHLRCRQEARKRCWDVVGVEYEKLYVF